MTRLASRRALGIAAGLIAGTTAMSGCVGSQSSAAGTGSSASSTSTSTTTAPPAQIQIAPTVASDARIPLSAPLSVKVSGGTLRSVTVTGPSGASVAGQLDAATGSWLPSAALTRATKYTVAATATNASGATTTQQRTLTTSATYATLNAFWVAPVASQVGNAQPVVINFTKPVTDRAAVERALKVSDTSNVEGAWRWLSSTRVDYRPKDFWPVGDKVTVSANLQGVSTSKGVWAAGTNNTSFTVNSDLQTIVDPATFTMTVYQGGKVIRTMPIDTGKPGLETLTGSMVVLDKEYTVEMKSCSVGLGCNPSSPNYYDEIVHWAVRITPSGTFVHAAPWDNQIGYVNSSHGCIHLSVANAEWFFGVAEPGTLVKVTGTINPVSITNGDGDWNLSWAQWTAPTS